MIPAIPAIASSLGSSGVQSIAQALSTQTPSAASASQSLGNNASFGSMLAQAVDGLQTVQANANAQALAVAAGTGNVTDATIAASEASLSTQLAVTLRNSVTSDINQIMATPF
jgi:flagellar hook-basal body complex protein FliE